MGDDGFRNREKDNLCECCSKDIKQYDEGDDTMTLCKECI